MATALAFPGSGLGSALDIRMRREARRRSNLLQPKTVPMDTTSPTVLPAPEEVRTVEEWREELAAWLAAMRCFTLGSNPDTRLAEKSLKLGTLPSCVAPTAKVLDPMEVLDDDFYLHKGGKDAEKELHGQGTLEYDGGSFVKGSWCHGVRHGTFTFDTNKPDAEVIYMEGDYREDMLEGRVVLQLRDGGWREGWFKAGVLHGFCRHFDTKKNLTFLGMYRNGQPFGTCWRLHSDGGAVMGRVNEEGELTGPDLAYLFPDLSTALVGTFRRGELVTGQAATLLSLRLDYGAVKVPLFTPGEGPLLGKEISTSDTITSLPLVPDPYELATVEVRQSSVPFAEEGLFARRAVPPDTVLAFYNGVRYIRPADAPQTWQNEANAYKIFDPSCKDGVFNIPAKYHSTANYCASLAHKTNHSFVPNCEFGEFQHPRWGLVPCIVSKHAMAAGEEAFVWYGYDLDFCPDWYLEAWEQQAFTVPDSMRSEYGLS